MSAVAAVNPEVDSRRTWGMGDAAVGFVAAIVLSNVGLGLWLVLTGAGEIGLGALAAGQVGLWAGFLGAPLWASRRKGSGSLAADFGLSLRGSDAWGLAIGAACQLLAVPALYFVIQQFTGELDIDGPARALAGRAHGPAFLVLAALVVFVAPVVEELFYRGLMLRSAERRYGTTAAVIGSSAVFGASHFQLVQFPALFGFGVVLAVLAVRTGRLGASIATHAAFNGVTMIALGLSR